jgi:hypothetical protein
MKRFLSIFILLIVFQQHAFSQRYKERIDSMLTVFSNAREDDDKVNLLVGILDLYSRYQSRTGLTYKDSALALADRLSPDLYLFQIRYLMR